MAAGGSSSASNSFSASFIRGAFFSIALIILFCGASFLRGADYKENIITSLPRISIPLTVTGKLQDPHASSEATHHDAKDETHHDEIAKGTHEQPSTEHNGNDHHEVTHDDSQDHHQEKSSHETSAHHDDDHVIKAAHNSIDMSMLYDENLVEQSQFGLIPKPNIRENLTPFNAYKRNFIQPSGQRKMQLILGPLTYTDEIAKNIASTLPQDISILISPYAPHPDQLMAIFKQSGHEVWMDLPFETTNSDVDTGPLTLRADFSANKNTSIYKRVLGIVPGFTGILVRDLDNTTVSVSSARMEQLFTDMYQRGIGFSYVSKEPHKVLELIAKTNDGEIRRIASVNDLPFSMVEANFNKMLTSKEDISLLHNPHPDDIISLNKWIGTLPEKGYVLSPLSADAK